MNEKEIIEGNKLIAEFMGATACMIRVKSIGNMEGFECDDFKMTIDELPYRNSWDWIMPVVEKIENFGLHVNIQRGGTSINSLGVEDINYPWLQEYDKAFPVMTHDMPSRIQGAWETIVKFIQWYNTQPTPTNTDNKG